MKPTACGDCECCMAASEERTSFYMDYHEKRDVETKAALVRAEQAEAHAATLRRRMHLHHCEYGESSVGCSYCPPEVPCTVCRLRAAEAVIREVVEHYGPWHDDDCPGDDTCDCSAKPLHDRINAALGEKAEATLCTMRSQIEALERIIPSELEGEDAWWRNGEYVSLHDVLALFPAPEKEQR